MSLKLNSSQKKAIEHSTGPILVVAGAGTGKTRVITQRIKYLIEKKKISPKEIIALTFTEKASNEMLGRVDDVMPLGYEEPWINTFHSFADRILKLEGIEIGLDTGYEILSSSEQWILFRKHLFDFDLSYFRPLGNPTKFISAILRFISRLQDENISPQDLQEYVDSFSGEEDEKKRWYELAKTYTKYQEIKIENSKLDFGDLIVWTIKLFKDRPLILKKYQSQFKHVLVDEFQDTNHAQYELIKLLCPVDKLTDRSLLVVGDDSQSIYKFRGAAVSNILEFQEDYPKSEMITLLSNYRSTQGILDSSYELIQNNNPDTLESKLGISKELKSEVTGAKTSPNLYCFETLEDEVEFTVKRILEILAEESSYTYKDFAILARANNHLDPFVFALRKYGLPYQLVGNRGLYDREEVRDIMALLKFIIDPTDPVNSYRVLNIDVLGVPSEVISSFLSLARSNKTSLWEEIKISQDPHILAILNLMKVYLDQITKLSPSEFIYKLVGDIKYIEPLITNETLESQMSVRNLDLFLNKAKQFEIRHQQDTNNMPTIVDFVDYLDLMIEAGENPAQAEIQDVDTVNLMTVHSSKGLEFPVVFMVNLVSGRFPTRNRKDVIDLPDAIIKESLPSGDAHIQEERRLFYVGMTRAQKYLYLTYAKNYGGKKETTPSGYINELSLKCESMSSEEVKNFRSQIGLFGVESGFREPKAEKITDFNPKFLSYTQVNTYQTCPLKYKYNYILNIPQPPSHALSFGSTIHDTLRDFHSSLLFNEVTLEQLYKMYEKNWQPAGYISKEHREAQFEGGKKLLKDYYEKAKKEPTKPIAIEKGFNVWLGGIKFFGRIDRIDPLPDGGVEIIDYKTGQTKEQKDVDKDEQVTFYAIGAKEALGYSPKKMTLYFVESGKKVTTTRTDSQLQEAKREVENIVAEIKSADFKATPGMHCEWCSYKEICPYAYKG